MQISETSFAVDFNKASCKKPLLDCYFIKPNNAGSIATTYQISTSCWKHAKNYFDRKYYFSILSNLNDDAAFELTLLVAQSTGGHSLNFSGTFKTPGAASISLSATAGAVDILKFISIDGGNVWYVYKQGSDLR
jgi:hypothetical protein